MTDIAVRPTELLDQLASNGALRTTGLYLTDPNISYDQLEAVGALLGTNYSGLRFALGDWLLTVEAMYPEKFSQAAEVLGISEEGRREFMRVSSKVPHSIRREKSWLKWSHYRAVAALKIVDSKTGEVHTDHAAQREWLEIAETERLSHAALRDRLRNGSAPDPGVCRCCKRPL